MGNEELFPDIELQKGHQREKQTTGRKVVFRMDHRNQQFLLPPSLDEFVPPDHLARFIDAVVDRLDLSEILARYKGGGASAYHPALLLKIWLFGWLRKIYTSRPLALACRRDVEFMWLTGNQTPSFMTLSDFRKKLGKDIKTIFKEVVKMAMTAGVIDGSEIYIDHTKMEANANRNRMIWRKNAERFLSKVEVELDKLLELIDRLNSEEENESSSPEEKTTVSDITPDMLDNLANRINQQLKEGKKGRDQGADEKNTLRKGKKRIEQQKKYQSILEELGDKTSMSMGDREAPAMMMKDKVSIKPGYNVGITTQNGIVTGFDISDNSNDANSFKILLTEAQHNLDTKAKRVCADAGYGNEENYLHLEELGIESYVKYPGWDKDLKGNRSPFEAESFLYQKENNCWICPNEKELYFTRVVKRENKRTGYETTSQEYRARVEDCSICPLKEKCTKGEARSILINGELRRHRKNVVANLDSPMGRRMRSLRSIEVETIFGIQKQALGFRRFHLCGKIGVSIETGLFLTANNLRRLHQHFIRYAKYGISPVNRLAIE